MKTNLMFRAVLFSAFMIFLTSAYSQCGGGHNHSANSSSTQSIDNGTSNEVLYACPMHSGITSKEAGYCSKCGMELVKNTETSESREMKMMCEMMHNSKEDNNHHKNKIMLPMMGIAMGLKMAVMMIFVANN